MCDKQPFSKININLQKTSENQYLDLKFGTGKFFGTGKPILTSDFENFQARRPHCGCAGFSRTTFLASSNDFLSIHKKIVGIIVGTNHRMKGVIRSLLAAPLSTNNRDESLRAVPSSRHIIEV